MGKHLVVGDVVAGGLGHALIALAAESEDIAIPQLLLHVPGHGMNVITDKTDRTGGENRDRLGMEQVVDLLDGRRQLLLATEDDVRVLHVRGKTVGHVVFAVRAGIGLVAPGQPGVEAAPDRAVHQVDDVPGRAHDHALAAGVGAAAHGDDARDGAHVGGDFRGGVLQGLVDEDLLGPFSGHLGRVFFQELFFDVRGCPLNELFLCSCHVILLGRSGN